MHYRRGNEEPNGNEAKQSDVSGIDRRGFLTKTGAAAASLGAVFSGRASAAQTDSSAGELGYGTQVYGETGYGGIQTTN